MAQAQGVPGGVERGAREGERAAGPVGAIVGGTIGGVVGGVAGILGVDDRPRFRTYVVEQRRPSYQYRDEVRVGAVLPSDGVTYYEVPEEYGVRDYRYTVVNGRTVLVEPRPVASSRSSTNCRRGPISAKAAARRRRCGPPCSFGTPRRMVLHGKGTALTPAGQKRIGQALLADARAGAVAADEADIVAERQQLVVIELISVA